jgi:hypothetical protein
MPDFENRERGIRDAESSINRALVLPHNYEKPEESSLLHLSVPPTTITTTTTTPKTPPMDSTTSTSTTTCLCTSDDFSCCSTVQIKNSMSFVSSDNYYNNNNNNAGLHKQEWSGFYCSCFQRGKGRRLFLSWLRRAAAKALLGTRAAVSKRNSRSRSEEGHYYPPDLFLDDVLWLNKNKKPPHSDHTMTEGLFRNEPEPSSVIVEFGPVVVAERFGKEDSLLFGGGEDNSFYNCGVVVVDSSHDIEVRGDCSCHADTSMTSSMPSATQLLSLDKKRGAAGQLSEAVEVVVLDDSSLYDVLEEEEEEAKNDSRRSSNNSSSSKSSFWNKMLIFAQMQ